MNAKVPAVYWMLILLDIAHEAAADDELLDDLHEYLAGRAPFSRTK